MQYPTPLASASRWLIDASLSESTAGTRDWGICTECGMGRVDDRDVPSLLDLHREILQAQSHLG
jgi:hypothetical protein